MAAEAPRIDGATDKSFDWKQKLGQGTFGQAILVAHKKDGALYCIKQIDGYESLPARERSECDQEVMILKALRHPNITSYVGHFVSSGSLKIIMEFCDGGDLNQEIFHGGKHNYPEDTILNWVAQIGCGLLHIHSHRIIHRDLKAGNVFLSKKHRMCKLADFGLSKELATLEMAKTAIGTPYYMCPELVQNKPYNNKSDIWALGCIIYELCTRQRVFKAGNIDNLVQKINRGTYDPIPKQYSKSLSDLIASCLRANPKERPSSRAFVRVPCIKEHVKKFVYKSLLVDELGQTFLTSPLATTQDSGKKFALRVSVRNRAKMWDQGAPSNAEANAKSTGVSSGERSSVMNGTVFGFNGSVVNPSLAATLPMGNVPEIPAAINMAPVGGGGIERPMQTKRKKRNTIYSLYSIADDESTATAEDFEDRQYVEMLNEMEQMQTLVLEDEDDSEGDYDDYFEVTLEGPRWGPALAKGFQEPSSPSHHAAAKTDSEGSDEDDDEAYEQVKSLMKTQLSVSQRYKNK